jgi:CheY-like chemotaxis protein
VLAVSGAQLPASFHGASERPHGSGSRTNESGEREKVLDSKRLVLVVEDYEDALELLVSNLRQAGLEVVAARDGAEAVDFAVRLRPRVVLMDLALPNLDGWEATRRIRTELGYATDLSIIAVSAMTGDSARAEAMRAGCDGFVAKPCTPDVVLSVVQTFLDRTDS